MTDCCLCVCLRPSYSKRAVAGLFPRNTTGAELDLKPQGVGPLVEYAQRKPHKLPKLALYGPRSCAPSAVRSLVSAVHSVLEQQVRRDLRKHRYGYVMLAMKAFDAIIQGCANVEASNVQYFEDHVRGLVRDLLKHEVPLMRVVGAETFSQLVNSQDDMADFADFEPFLQPLLDMCGSRSGGPQFLKVQAAGVKAVTILVQKVDRTTLATFIPAVIPVMLALYQREFERSKQETKTEETKGFDGPADREQEANLLSLTSTCITCMAVNTTPVTINKLLDPMFHYLDGCTWLPKEFAVECCRLVQSALPHRQSLFIYLLKHSASMDDEGHAPLEPLPEDAEVPAAVAARVADSAGTAIRQQHPKLWLTLKRAIIGVATELLRHTQMYVTVEATLVMISQVTLHLPRQSTTVELFEAYQRDLVTALEVVVSKIDNTQELLNSLSVMLEETAEHRAAIKQRLLSLVLRLARARLPVLGLAGETLREEALYPLLSALTEAQLADVRVLAAQVLCALTPDAPIDALSNYQPSVDMIMWSQREALHSALYYAVTTGDLQLQAHLDAFGALLTQMLRSGGAAELARFVPWVFKVQAHFSQLAPADMGADRRGGPAPTASTLWSTQQAIGHAFCLALLQYVGYVLHCTPLVEYLQHIRDARAGLGGDIEFVFTRSAIEAHQHWRAAHSPSPNTMTGTDGPARDPAPVPLSPSVGATAGMMSPTAQSPPLRQMSDLQLIQQAIVVQHIMQSPTVHSMFSHDAALDALNADLMAEFKPQPFGQYELSEARSKTAVHGIPLAGRRLSAYLTAVESRINESTDEEWRGDDDDDTPISSIPEEEGAPIEATGSVAFNVMVRQSYALSTDRLKDLAYVVNLLASTANQSPHHMEPIEDAFARHSFLRLTVDDAIGVRVE